VSFFIGILIGLVSFFVAKSTGYDIDELEFWGVNAGVLFLLLAVYAIILAAKN